MPETVKKAVGNGNLKPWKKGQSGNPNGRPKKGYSITEMMREMLSAQPEIKEGIGKRIAQKALQGDHAAIKMLWQYMDGKAPQPIGKFGEDGEIEEQSMGVVVLPAVDKS